MSEGYGDEAPRPVMSPESVDAAAGSARARVTYANLAPDNPGHPLTEGGFWGDFMQSLSGRWERFKTDADPTAGTFENDDADGQTRLVTDGGRDQGTERLDRVAEVVNRHVYP